MRKRLAMWSALMALAWGVAAATSLAEADSAQLRVASVDVTGRTSARVTVVVPRLLAGRTLPAQAFSVHSGVIGVPTSVEPLPDRDVDLALVIDDDPSIEAATFTAAKAAAVDFVRTLSDGTRVSVGVASRSTPLLALSADHTAVIGTIASLRKSDGVGGASGLSLDGFAAPPLGRRRAVVVVASTAAASSHAADEHARSRNGDGSVVYVLDMAGTPASQPAVVSPLDGGLMVSAGSSELVAGFDAIRADLGGRYLLEFAAPATVAGGPVAVSVEVNAFGMAADARLELANRPAQTASPSSSPEPTSHTASTGWYVVIVVAGILLVAAVEFGWIVTTHAKRSARSRRHQRAPRHAAHRH